MKMVFVGNSVLDDGITYGPAITSGKIGFGGEALTLGRYDDALVIGN